MRVLEPSPPAVAEAPWFADDPVAGGEVVPVERAGTRSWREVCDERGDAALTAWCEDRWLVRGGLRPLPAGFAATVDGLHQLAEHVLAPIRHAATGKIGLRFTYHGFGTPFFADDRQVRVEDGVLLDGDRRHELTTVAVAAAFLGIEPGAPAGVYQPNTLLRTDEPLTVEPDAARALGHWYGYCASLLEQLRAESTDASRVQLWPEHFDLAVDLGAEGSRANFGGSPGDAGHPEPYLYVGPWETREGPYWNEPFGASLSYAALVAGEDGLAFFRRGVTELTTR